MLAAHIAAFSAPLSTALAPSLMEIPFASLAIFRSNSGEKVCSQGDFSSSFSSFSAYSSSASLKTASNIFSLFLSPLFIVISLQLLLQDFFAAENPRVYCVYRNAQKLGYLGGVVAHCKLKGKNVLIDIVKAAYQ